LSKQTNILLLQKINLHVHQMEIKNKLISFLILFFYATIFTNSSYAQNWSLDATFNGNGKVITGLMPSVPGGNEAALQSDGKIVVAGYTIASADYDFAVVRLNMNGSVDSTFDDDGLVSTDIDSNSYDGSRAIAIQTDGKIVVVGYSLIGSGYDFVVVRYHSSGSLDSTFGGDGIVTTDVGGAGDEGVSVALQSDGKIVVAGYRIASADYDFAVVRYNTDGTLDNSFDSDGILTSDLNSGSDDFVAKVLVQSDGKILLAGTSGSGGDFAVVRYNSNGSLDLSFSTDGKVTTDLGGNENGRNIAIQGDGKIVVVGSTSDSSNNIDFALVRYNSNGTLDNSFDGDGILIRGLTSAGRDEAFAVAIQSDGKILAGGLLDKVTDTDFAIARYNSDGSTDSSFNSVGRILTDFGFSDDYCSMLLLQSDGKIVAAGYQVATIAVARYTNEILSGLASTNIIDKSIVVYPNPAKDFISISLTDIEQSINADYTITDLSGRVIMKGKLTEKNTRIDVNGLLPGMYLLQVHGQLYEVVKIIKQ
jgi:uncharacterized delta-60 repeat protein